MRLEQLSLKSFRNYDQLTIQWNPHLNIIVGENASGKSNILEAIYYLSHSKSPRTHQDKELIQWQESFSRIHASIYRPERDNVFSLDAVLLTQPGKPFKTTFKHNETVLKKRSAIIGLMPTVTFFLSDLLMLRGSPEDRRHVLDAAIAQYSPAHVALLASYLKVKHHKTALLKSERLDLMLLDQLNQQLAQAAVAVILSRFHYIQDIKHLVYEAYYRISPEELTLNYVLSCADDQADWQVLQSDQLLQFMLEKIQHRQADEIRRQQVLVGPHRDDIQFLIEAKDATHFASQGQQRTCVLAFKQAELAMLTNVRQELPIILMDDVMAELDPKRQAHLIESLDARMQVFLTTTHLDSRLETLTRLAQSSTLWHTKDGTLSSQEVLV
jgi:DNA replication and repair protein RecF